MQPRNIHIEKKWLKNQKKNFLMFFYTGGIKSEENRKLRRLCKMHNINYWVLPSSFAIKSLFYAQGPSITTVYAENINFESYKALNTKTSTAIFDKNRAYPSSFLKDFKKLQSPHDLCLMLCDLIEAKNDTTN